MHIRSTAAPQHSAFSRTVAFNSAFSTAFPPSLSSSAKEFSSTVSAIQGTDSSRPAFPVSTPAIISAASIKNAAPQPAVNLSDGISSMAFVNSPEKHVLVLDPREKKKKKRKNNKSIELFQGIVLLLLIGSAIVAALVFVCLRKWSKRRECPSDTEMVELTDAKPSSEYLNPIKAKSSDSIPQQVAPPVPVRDEAPDVTVINFINPPERYRFVLSSRDLFFLLFFSLSLSVSLSVSLSHSLTNGVLVREESFSFYVTKNGCCK